MNVANLLTSHGVGSGGFHKNSFVPLGNAGIMSERVTTFSSGSTPLNGGLVMDNAGNIYTVDQTRTLRKHRKIGAMLLSITLPPEMNVPTEIRMEYIPSLDRIFCFDRFRLMVLDSSLNILYNQPFPDQPNRMGWIIYAIRGKYLYHVMSNNQGPGCRMQKFDSETLAYAFDNYNPTTILISGYSTLEVDNEENFYGIGNSQLHKYSKLGNKLWSAPIANAPYIYFDKTVGQLYVVTGSGQIATVDPSTGAVTYLTTIKDISVNGLNSFRAGGSVESNGIRLMKYSSGNSYSPSMMSVYKDSELSASIDVARLANITQSSNLHSVVFNKGNFAAVFQDSNQITLFRAGVKIL
ncbi:hypothetical protein AB432_026265 [Brevibacillus brevis]|uniref:Uncharacterized protein n=1 Tax=Brevibacillus brevis TaxID=1393 RepID=A0A2Z4MP80_BREBE|nr:hypothetical protein [Brevibacillus brevis]AWX58328.1 hypothetical protein AB432_026265 [Brevibacillus brevis]